MGKQFQIIYKKERMKGFAAFTLAEVLVTLGIIGVVSAMTIPTLMSNHQKLVYVSQLKKVYSQLSQAAERAISDNNAVSLDETKYNLKHANGAYNFFHDYFKVVKDCGTTLTPCFAPSYETLDGSAFTLETPVTVLTLADGTSISCFQNYLEYAPDEHGSLYLQIDLNGASGPNILGRDLFYIELYSDGKVGESYTRDPADNADGCDGTAGSDYGLGCLSKIINDGWKMDY